jgi:hypothetical protein
VSTLQRMNGESSRLTFIRILVKPSESVDLVIANISDGGVDQARRPGADRGYYLGSITLPVCFSLTHWTRGHQERIVGGGRRGGSRDALNRGVGGGGGGDGSLG